MKNKNLWSLDYYLAKKILKPLKAFKKMERSGYPSDLTEKKWEKVLDDMIYGIEFIIEDDWKPEETVKQYCKRHDKAQKGLELFGKYFLNLWD